MHKCLYLYIGVYTCRKQIYAFVCVHEKYEVLKKISGNLMHEMTSLKKD